MLASILVVGLYLAVPITLGSTTLLRSEFMKRHKTAQVKILMRTRCSSRLLGSY